MCWLDLSTRDLENKLRSLREQIQQLRADNDRLVHGQNGSGIITDSGSSPAPSTAVLERLIYVTQERKCPSGVEQPALCFCENQAELRGECDAVFVTK